MKIEEHPKLEHLNALLRRVDVGDRYISARLEMFSVEAKNVPSRLKKKLILKKICGYSAR